MRVHANKNKTQCNGTTNIYTRKRIFKKIIKIN